jgi:hypothetical protein
METHLIGLPRSGKTTIFNALTGRSAGFSGSGGGKKQVNLAEVEVPDPRIERLGAIFQSRKVVPASVLFKDLSMELAPQGGIPAAALAELRAADAVTLVVRAFDDPGVPHPLGALDPRRDLIRLLDALVFGDYEVAEKRLERLAKEGARGGREHQVLERVSARLAAGEPIGRRFLSEDEEKLLSGFRFLTAKPIIVVANTGEIPAGLAGLEEEAARRGLELFPIQGAVEMEIARLDPGEQREFLLDLGLEEPAKNRFLRRIYESLQLISFLTAGEKEVHAWSISLGSTAIRAAGKIHSDLEKGFIRAEVVYWRDLVETGGYSQARKAGKLRLEGKEYGVRDGDVLVIRFNV